jgi:uncharacterized protein (DUF2147 family)
MIGKVLGSEPTPMPQTCLVAHPRSRLFEETAMRKSYRTGLLAVLILAATGSFLSHSPALSQQAGKDNVWRNPSNSVHVRVYQCGNSRCGTVVWANAKAKADSERGGTANLVGTQLFREFREVSPKVWKGKVFVPDLNKVFTGTGTIKDENTVVARGCLIGNIGCKSQTWKRVD